jgi:hypothetical protein
MLYRTLTAVMLIALAGCEKQYKKSQNDDVAVVQNLNSGSYNEVISDLSGRSSLTPREKYYLAGAYSRSGGVDVFSLYSIMEIQLFHKNALEWSELSKDKNPYLKFMKTQDGVDLKARKAKREKKWAENLPDIMRLNNFSSVMAYEELPTVLPTVVGVTKEEFDLIEADLRAKFVEVEKLEVPVYEKSDKMYDHPCNYPPTQISPNEIQYSKNSVCYELRYQFGDTIVINDMKDRYLNPEKRNDSIFSDEEWEMTLMSVLWNTYEAIPLMRKMPTLTVDQQNEVSKSLELYSEIIDSTKFKEVSLKNIAILSGVSLLSLYKESFELESINSIQDLYCDFSPDVLMKNYGLIRKRLIFLSEVAQKVDVLDPEYEQYRSKMEDIKAKLPETLDLEQQDHYRQSVKEFQLNRCFNS